jgi:UDP-N-acetylmuramyl pentapeptide synthase
MDCLCIGDLADITGGDLRLGILPPLGGAWEPVDGMVTDSRTVSRGDVFWDLPRPRLEPGASVEEAFARGALGVVTCKPSVEPWAGAFAIQVRDSHRALVDAGRWARRRSHDQVITVTCGSGSPLPQLLALTCQASFMDSSPDFDQIAQFRHELELHDRFLTSSLFESSVELALYFLHRPARSGFSIVPMNSERIHDCSAISDLCCPHLAVINCSPCGNAREAARRVKPWLEALPTDGIAILVSPPPDLILERRVTEEIQVIRVGMSETCDWRIDQVKPQGSKTQLELNKERIVWSLSPEWPLSDVVAAYVASHVLGFDRGEFMTACDYLVRDGSNKSRSGPLSKAPVDVFEDGHELQTKKTRVPPLVSGLRESDTALPPGLKRFAC